MNQLEKLIDEFCDSNRVALKRKFEETIITDDDIPNLMNILKSFISKRKMMWNSILECVKIIESDEKYLFETLNENELNYSKNNESEEMIIDDSINDPMNATFIKYEMKDDNSMCLDITDNNLSEDRSENLIKNPIKLTPISKPIKKEKKQRTVLLKCQLETIEEVKEKNSLY